MKESIKKYIELEVQAIQNIPIDGVIENVLDIIFVRVHQMNGKVIVSGMGKARIYSIFLKMILVIFNNEASNYNNIFLFCCDNF